MPFIPISFVHKHGLYDDEIDDFLTLNSIEPHEIYLRDEPKDKIPNGNSYYVINLDDEDGYGTHWTSLFVKNKLAYYYDSFGLPCPNEIVEWVKEENHKKLYYVDNQHQPNDSILCGYYACYFLYSMHKNMPINVYMDMFEDNGEESNDDKLLRLMHIGTPDQSDYVVDGTKNNPKRIKMDIEINNEIDEEPTAPKKKEKGKGFDLVKKLNNLMPGAEFHLHDVKFNDYGLPVGLEKHSFTGPNTDLEKRISNIDELMNESKMEDITYSKINYITDPIDDSIDRFASIHDLQYSWIEKNVKDDKEKLKMVHEADKILQNSAYNTMKDGKKPIQKRIQGAIVSLIMGLKRKVGVGSRAPGKSKELQFLVEFQAKMTPKQKMLLKILNDNKRI